MSGHIGSGIVGFGTLGGRTEATGGENYEDGHDPLRSVEYVAARTLFASQFFARSSQMGKYIRLQCRNLSEDVRFNIISET